MSVVSLKPQRAESKEIASTPNDVAPIVSRYLVSLSPQMCCPVECVDVCCGGSVPWLRLGQVDAGRFSTIFASSSPADGWLLGGRLSAPFDCGAAFCESVGRRVASADVARSEGDGLGSLFCRCARRQSLVTSLMFVGSTVPCIFAGCSASRCRMPWLASHRTPPCSAKSMQADASDWRRCPL